MVFVNLDGTHQQATAQVGRGIEAAQCFACAQLQAGRGEAQDKRAQSKSDLCLDDHALSMVRPRRLKLHELRLHRSIPCAYPVKIAFTCMSCKAAYKLFASVSTCLS